jgi:hypothetical protein
MPKTKVEAFLEPRIDPDQCHRNIDAIEKSSRGQSSRRCRLIQIKDAAAGFAL